MTRRSFIKNTAATTLGAAAVKSGEKSAAARQARASKGKAKDGKRKVLTDRAPKPAGPYSQAIVSGDMIFVAGQGPVDPKTGEMPAGGISEQAAQTLENIKSILETAGASLADVVKVNVYLAGLADFGKMNEVYVRYFPEPYPARATIGAQLLGNMLIEVECVAIKPGP